MSMSIAYALPQIDP